MNTTILATTRTLCLSLLPLGLAACGSLAPEYYAGDGKHLVSDLAPAPFSIALKSIATPDASAPGDGIGLYATDADLREMILSGLRDVDAASMVIDASTQSDGGEADLEIELSLAGKPSFLLADTHTLGPLAGWFLTYFTLWGMEEETYQSGFRFDCTVKETQSGHEIGKFQIASGEVGVTYWDRMGMGFGSFLGSIVLPQFWSSDDVAVSDAITQEACRQVAAQVARQLKEELHPDQKIKPLDFDNGQYLSSSRFKAQVEATQEIAMVTVFLNSDPNGRQVADSATTSGEAQYQDGTYSLKFEHSGGRLRSGTNLLRVLVRLNDGSHFSRTFRVSH